MKMLFIIEFVFLFMPLVRADSADASLLSGLVAEISAAEPHDRYAVWQEMEAAVEAHVAADPARKELAQGFDYWLQLVDREDAWSRALVSVLALQAEALGPAAVSDAAVHLAVSVPGLSLPQIEFLLNEALVVFSLSTTLRERWPALDKFLHRVSVRLPAEDLTDLETLAQLQQIIMPKKTAKLTVGRDKRDEKDIVWRSGNGLMSWLPRPGLQPSPEALASLLRVLRASFVVAGRAAGKAMDTYDWAASLWQARAARLIHDKLRLAVPSGGPADLLFAETAVNGSLEEHLGRISSYVMRLGRVWWRQEQAIVMTVHSMAKLSEFLFPHVSDVEDMDFQTVAVPAGEVGENYLLQDRSSVWYKIADKELCLVRGERGDTWFVYFTPLYADSNATEVAHEKRIPLKNNGYLICFSFGSVGADPLLIRGATIEQLAGFLATDTGIEVGTLEKALQDFVIGKLWRPLPWGSAKAP